MNKEIDVPSSLGIRCTDPELLRSRLLVSGLTILEPYTAEARGYGHREVIVPTPPHKPTDEQLNSIIANEKTLEQLHLVSLPASIGKEAIRYCQEPSFVRNPANYRDLGSDFIGAPDVFRYDQPDQINVSVDNESLKVGDHIDTWEDPAVQFAILNMGPGARWHRITPAFSRDDMEGRRPSPDVRHEYMRSMIESGISKRLLAYWMLLEAPSLDAEGNQVVDAVVPSPVARMLHDGSTLGNEASGVVTIAVPPGASMSTRPSLV